ncbi:MAG: hypothetical protein HY509_05960, partial [Acidobacteria bacterium]|nr:hypothetical protein [Acidobacteriota bacterium]
MRRPQPEPLRIRWSRASALAGLELREFLRRPAHYAFFFGALATAQAAKWCLEAWLRSPAGLGPNAYRAVADTLTWGLAAAGLTVFETFSEKRSNREIEPILATGMREMEIVLGKVAVPAAAALVAAGAVLAGEGGLRILVPGLPPPLPAAMFLWLVLFLPPFSAGAATLPRRIS